ncbi:serum response factor homolog isoform X1 [Aedes albopictus]|uniref:MADS-box domain-containing protein n=2 Tax=Stegomyia TaxID=53541 RepID=A0ABM1ZY69_AEDAL|nr:serum response factor homolog isoform X1 [Aedes albopictus]XP_029721502.1 serum response factor homolog isoform X1 [Aedes albopictus]
MDPNAARDSRYNLNYSMSMMSETPEIYGNPNVSLARPPSGGLVGQVMSRGGGLMSAGNGPQCGAGGGGGGGGGGGSLSRGIKRANSDCYDDGRQMVGSQGLTGLEGCNVGSDVVDESYTSLQPKKSPPSNGKKTKGRVKIKMEYIDNKLRRYTTFSKRKTGIMKKAYELSTLTGTQVMLLVASETGHVYTFATRKLQPMITSEAGKALIQTCLNSPDPPTGSSGDQRMSATGFEETELSYNIGDEDSKVRQLVYGHGHHGHAHLGHPQTGHYGLDQSLMQQPYPVSGQGSPLSHAQSYPPHSGHSHHSHIPHHSHTAHMSHAHAQR